MIVWRTGVGGASVGAIAIGVSRAAARIAIVRFDLEPGSDGHGGLGDLQRDVAGAMIVKPQGHPTAGGVGQVQIEDSATVDASSATERMRNLKMTQNVLTFTAAGR